MLDKKSRKLHLRFSILFLQNANLVKKYLILFQRQTWENLQLWHGDSVLEDIFYKKTLTNQVFYQTSIIH